MDFLCSQLMKVSHAIIFHDYWDAQTLDENKGEGSPLTFMNFEWISFGVKPPFTKNFITTQYSILAILRDTDNTPASDSCIKQTTW